MLNSEEELRYARQISVPGFGPIAQEKLKAASVLVIGAGGLGCPALLYLAACGIGEIGIADHDTVSLSNLQRQILFPQTDIGRKKCEAAAERIAVINPHVRVQSHFCAATPENIIELFSNYDLILDCTDNFETRYLINDACVLTEKCCVSASLYRFQGQVYVLNALMQNGERSCDYRQLFPESENQASGVNCNTSGVIGSVAGIIGTIQATEAIKVLTGTGEALINRILYLDSRDMQTQILEVEPEPKAEGTFPKSIEELRTHSYHKTKACLSPVLNEEEMHREICDGNVTVIDVREYHEQPELNVKNKIRIPFSELTSGHEALKGLNKVICICQSGKRSKMAVQILAESGIEAYSFSKGVEDWNLYGEKYEVI